MTGAPLEGERERRAAPVGEIEPDLLIEPERPGPAAEEPEAEEPESALEVFRNRPFLLLWLSQAATQIGGNMVLYGLTVIILEATRSNTAVSFLILTFLVPAVLFSAVAGVYVDRFDRRAILIVTNVLRGAAFVLTFLVGSNVAAILLLNVFVSTVTVFFAPAEAAMIPRLVSRGQLISANGIFTLTLNAAFALGFALAGPIVVTIAGAPALILLVAILYLVAAVLCWTLPPAPPVSDEALDPRTAVADAERAVGSTVAQLREGLAFVRLNPAIAWSLVYLGIAASLVGVLGVLGPDFAAETLGLEPKDLVVVVLPLGIGIVMGVFILNAFGKYLPRRRVIELGLVLLGVLLALLAVSGPVARFLQRAEQAAGLLDLSALTSLLAIVVLIAFLAGIAYAFVAIPAQTQLQEDLPEDVRGRVFGILNMLVSVASFLPIIAVGPISDLAGTTAVIIGVAALVAVAGVVSIATRGPLRPTSAEAATSPRQPAPVDPVGVMIQAELHPDFRFRDPDSLGIAPAGGEPIPRREPAPRPTPAAPPDPPAGLE
ncbi:MAG TPA: MFS transporter [Candidatus Limnocylindrales bacterium]|nr:MFS transporter [Candidatus Limnocylindrales bacterium]